MQTKKTTLGVTALALAGIALFHGCGTAGSGSGSSGGSGTPGGTISMAMTDAPSDEIESFIVEVDALTLRRQDGAVVSVINSPMSIDLASLSDTTELLNHVTVPAGSYTSAVITFDFTNATCVLVGQNVPAQILNSTGVAVTGTLTLPVQFASAPMIVVLDKHRLLELDFDLNQSCNVDSASNVVRLEPAVVLHIDGSGKELESVGALVSVNSGTSSFVGNVKTSHGIVLGNVTYTADANTIYQVDGVPGTGATGLSELAAKSSGTSLQVYGHVDPDSSAIVAEFVQAGTGTYNGLKDIIEGHVIDRQGNPTAGSNVILSVLGRSSNALHTTFQYNKTFTVTTNFANTKVVRPFSSQAFDMDDVNVGQRVRIFGLLNGTSMSATQPNDVIREQVSRTFGHATGAIAGTTLTLNLTHVDLHLQSAFSWLDSGNSPPIPSAFTADVGTLGTNLGIVNGTAVEVRGFLSSVDDSVQDLSAQTLINLDTAPTLLFIRNVPGGFTVGVTATPLFIQIGITGVAFPAEKAILDMGYAGFVQLPTVPAPNITPAGSGGLFMLRDKLTGTVTAYFTFTTFSAALANVMAAGANIVTISATGAYTGSTNTLQANLVSVIVN
jgi:hypothetical protein